MKKIKVKDGLRKAARITLPLLEEFRFTTTTIYDLLKKKHERILKGIGFILGRIGAILLLILVLYAYVSGQLYGFIMSIYVFMKYPILFKYWFLTEGIYYLLLMAAIIIATYPPLRFIWRMAFKELYIIDKEDLYEAVYRKIGRVYFVNKKEKYMWVNPHSYLNIFIPARSLVKVRYSDDIKIYVNPETRKILAVAEDVIFVREGEYEIIPFEKRSEEINTEPLKKRIEQKYKEIIKATRTSLHINPELAKQKFRSTYAMLSPDVVYAHYEPIDADALVEYLKNKIDKFNEIYDDMIQDPELAPDTPNRLSPIFAEIYRTVQKMRRDWPEFKSVLFDFLEKLEYDRFRESGTIPVLVMKEFVEEVERIVHNYENSAYS